MLQTKNTKLILGMTTAVLCVLLFLQRLTGGVWHAAFGILIIAVAVVHLYRQRGKCKHRAFAIQLIDGTLIALLGILFVSGMLLHPFQDLLVLKIVHKLAAVLFVFGVIAHLIQHKVAGRA